MRPLRIYLDTSIISFLLADDAPEKRQITIELFDKFIRTGVYATFISNVVIAEIENTPDEEKRTKLLRFLQDYPLEAVEIQSSEEVEHLAAAYIEEGVIPATRPLDALHVAIAVVNEMDILLSWNYRHLANVHRERRIVGVNTLLGYTRNFRIITPYEVINI